MELYFVYTILSQRHEIIFAYLNKTIYFVNGPDILFVNQVKVTLIHFLFCATKLLIETTETMFLLKHS